MVTVPPLPPLQAEAIWETVSVPVPKVMVVPLTVTPPLLRWPPAKDAQS